MTVPHILIQHIPGADPSLPTPAYATEGAAGADVRADLGGSSVTLKAGERALIPTGLRMQIPVGWEVQIRPRSGLAVKSGVTVLNSPGTIDCDYRGPVGVILVNHGSEDHTVNHGDRIAQIVVAPAPQATFALVSELDDTPRGQLGFGSTGKG